MCDEKEGVFICKYCNCCLYMWIFLWSYLSYEKFDGSFNIGTTDYIKSYSGGEYINVYVDYETYAQIKIKKMSFKLRYSDGLKLVKNEIVKGSQITDYEVNKISIR